MRSPRALSTVGLVVGLLATTLSGAVAQAGQTITVAQDGSADFETITSAVEAAAPGDIVLVSPGVYAEDVYIDKDLTLAGTGARHEVVIAPTWDQAELRELDFFGDPGRGPVGLYVADGDVLIEHLSVMGVDDDEPSIWLAGGIQTVRNVLTESFVGVRGTSDATIEDSDIARLGLAGPNTSVVRNNIIRQSLFASQGSLGSIEGNLVVDEPMYIDSGADVTVSGNTIESRESGVEVLEPGTVARVIDNDISAEWVGILVEFPQSVLVEGNVIDSADVGVVVLESDAIVRDNDIVVRGDVGVVLMGDGITLEGNTVSGGRIGLHLMTEWEDYPDEAVDVDDVTRVIGNTISGSSHFGIVIEGDLPAGSSGAILEGNTICAGREPLKIEGEPDPQIGTNEICQVSDD